MRGGERAGGTCRFRPELAGGVNAFPREAPRVVAPEVLEPTEAPPLPGRVLTVCGVDGLGREYAGQLLVYRPGDEFVAPYPVFWLGFGIASVSPGATATTTPNREELSRRCQG